MRVAGSSMVVAMLLSACANQASGVAESTPPVPAPTDLAQTCPPWDVPIRYAQGDLPMGAESVRLCPGPSIVSKDGTVLDVGIQPPRDLLTTRVDELVDAVNALDSAPGAMACPLDAGPRLTYWFTYAGGDARAVTFEDFGCEVLLVGPDERRVEGDRVARLFTEALLSQRADAEPPADLPDAPDCHGALAEPGTALQSGPPDLASASLCLDAGPYRLRQASVPTRLLPTLQRQLLGEPAVKGRCPVRARHRMRILGHTRWGDLVRYFVDRCGRVFMSPAPGWLREDQQQFQLPPALLAQLDSLPQGPVLGFRS